METETLSNHVLSENAMKISDIQDSESVKSSFEIKAQNAVAEDEVDKTPLETESDYECEEEEEAEKLLLSPTHSDKLYDTDDEPLTPILNKQSDHSSDDDDEDDKNKADNNGNDDAEDEKSTKEIDVNNSDDVHTTDNIEDKLESKDTVLNDNSDNNAIDSKEVKDESNSMDNSNEISDIDKERTDSSEKPVEDGSVIEGTEATTKKEVAVKDKNEAKSVEQTEEILDEDISIISDSTSNDATKLKETEGEDDIEMDEDFDPSLLCPELSMEVDEAPVITTNDAPAPDGSKSPLRLYDPIFSTFVDEMTGAEVDFNLTTEELELKAKTYGLDNPVQFTKIHCTACNVHLGSALDGQGNRFVHPLLKVLICKKCYHFYTSGEFEKDEDGSELYCRWCGQGGQVLCCSNCEMVFCKKCIRINFDRKKLADIQKSDDWLCFRCNSSQLIHLRIHCAEFIEYVQTEFRRAGTADNTNSLMHTDHTRCCSTQKKRSLDHSGANPAKKRRRFGEDEDPDYDPSKEREAAANASTPIVNPVVLTPRAPFTPNFRPTIVRTSATVAIRPRMSIVTTLKNTVRLPPGIRISGAGNAGGTAPVRAARPNSGIVPGAAIAMKHEWFEKTVRAAARVNSNLSYTLTQLNRAQSNATSIEGLAVVHNRLQEILSSSINSLIQIRKNLRTEFIAGIKNIRFPAKSVVAPSTSKENDDDVIIVSDDPPPLVSVVATNNKITLPPSISLLKKSPISTPSGDSNTASNVASCTKIARIARKKTASSEETNKQTKGGFLRVKSFSALQSVTSECITIPDDNESECDSRSAANDPVDPLEVTEVEPEDPLKIDNGQANGLMNGSVTGRDGNGECDEKDKKVAKKVEETSKKLLKSARVVMKRETNIQTKDNGSKELSNGVKK
ncbi:unnamed protein product [Phyllotreta striolata]|uniref:PHD-type domain-containing protein n=1 Tax=Phyllotreta striolata TaxID=444603 RepID=A0A9P0DNX6_PHYSR|nr:unnamed protein product [Phyllotreta striolata]